MWKSISVITFFTFGCLQIYAQSREKLEIERNRIINEIELTQKSLDQATRSRSAKINELKALQDKMSKREELIQNIKKSIQQANEDIQKNNETLNHLNAEVNAIKSQYQQLLRYQYVKRLSSNTWLYLLSAKNINDAFLRWRYAKQYENYTLEKSKEINTLSDDISERIKEIEENKNLQNDLLLSSSEQFKLLQAEREKENQYLRELSRDESRLRKDLEKAQNEREKLNKAIEDAIIAELARRDREKTVKSEEVTVVLSESFEENRGKFAWPVESGYVSNKFGVQPHPSIKGLKINNNGIDIVSKPGAQIKSIHNGKVIGVTSIPGYDNMVILQHGNFYTVYSKLAEVKVKNNQDVKAGTVLGKLSADNSVLHFEVWKNKSKVDPESWLKKGI